MTMVQGESIRAQHILLSHIMLTSTELWILQISPALERVNCLTFLFVLPPFRTYPEVN